MQGQESPSAFQARAAGVDKGSYTDRVAEAAHERVERIKERLEPREEHLREAATHAQTSLREARERGRDTYQEVADHTREYVREHPLTAAAVAFAAGVLVSAWMRR
jgi:ElaB/YqjD/DUF883 family membrane-anchored ribosome-binding protein